MFYFYFSLDSVVDLSTVCPEEQILNCNQPDMDDCEGCENQDEDAVAMVEELPSGIWAISPVNIASCYTCSKALLYFEKVMKLPTAMTQTGAWIFQRF